MVIEGLDVFAFWAGRGDAPPGLWGRLDSFAGDMDRLPELVAPLFTISTVEERSFRLTPTWALGSEVERLFKLEVLAHTDKSLKRLEPPAVWARELPVLSVFPIKRS